MEKLNVSHKAQKRLRVRRKSGGVGEEKPEKINKECEAQAGWS